MKALFTRLAAVACSLFAVGALNAQLVVNDSNDGEALASQIVGAGVSISNVVFDCAPGSAGIFSNGNTTNIGLNEGIILTTGAASDAIGPNISGSTTVDLDVAYHGDPDLQNVVAFSLQDACALSFDFVADAEVLTVQYSFASEEYNEYVCSQFNDAFAFFVTGPNPLGGDYANENVAIIPGTNLPVAINTVNNGSSGMFGSPETCTSLDYAGLFVDNTNGLTIEYDGFTVVLTSEIAIIPGESYHFKFVVADASDGALDSGVFIKANSFSIFNCQAGQISIDGLNGEVCIGDNLANPVQLSNNSPAADDTYWYLLTDNAGAILAISESGAFDLEDFGVGVFSFYGISTNGIVSGIEIGNNISDIMSADDEGCFELSSPLSYEGISCAPPCALEVICPSSEGGVYECISDIPAADPSSIVIVDGCNPVISVETASSGSGCSDDPYYLTYTYTVTDGEDVVVCSVNYSAIDAFGPEANTSEEPIVIACESDVYEALSVSDNCSEVVIEEHETTYGGYTGECEGFRTQTQGGWGAKAKGNNPGVYRNANFASAFPNGLTIGCVNTLVLTSAQAVQDFLPSGSTPSALPMGTLINPGGSYNNVLAGQLVAATLSIGFDANDPDFSESDFPMSQLIYNNGTFEGWTVAQVLAEANNAIGGCGSMYSFSQLNEALTMFNENYVDGNSDNGNFDCPGEQDPCDYTMTIHWTAYDACGNSIEIHQEFQVKDTVAPVFYGEPFTEVSCEDVPEFEVEVTDNCSEVTLTYSDVEYSGGCYGNVIRTWTAVDECGNVSTFDQIISIEDNTAPVISGTGDPINLACDELPVMPEVTATDNCGEVTLEVAEEIVPGDCPTNYTIIWTWTATDFCGNTSSAEQVVNVGDNGAPFFTYVPEDAYYECDQEPGFEWATADDDCGIASLDYSDGLIPGDCESEYTIVRTFVATDECGNQATAQQIIHVQDTQAPVLSGAPEDITIDCEGEIPAAEILTATDNCDEVVEVVFTQSGFEQENPEGAQAFCQLTTPVNMNPAWGLIIFDMPNGADEYLTQSVTFTEYPGDENGLEGHLAGTVVSATNPNAGWIIDVWFNQGVDWTAWDNKPWPTSYKDDFGIAGDNYLDWIYYLMVSGQATLTGWGDYEGSLLNLSHAPSNLYYAYQVGIAANNFNTEYGHGGWFYAEGTLIDNGMEYLIDLSGDFAFDANCCGGEIVRTWTATDCAGNSTSWTQTITLSDLGVENGLVANAVPTPEADCFGDINSDGDRNTGDILIILAAFGCDQACEADLDNDGKVISSDLLNFLTVYGVPCAE